MKTRMGRAVGRRAAVPERLRTWLFDPRSLTRRLCRACPGAFHVQVENQCWGRPLEAERELLALALRERVLIREVLLTCHGTPWVFARSVFPRQCLRGPQRRLSRLGQQPLGRLLFGNSRMRRVTVNVQPAETDPAMQERCIAALGRAPHDAWQRSSVFRRGEQALLVSEIFLEAFAGE
jgi:chorismate--pyruvate lyase